MNTFLKNLLCIALVLIAIQPAWAQVEEENEEEDYYTSGDEKIKGGWGFNIQVSSIGFVLGGLYSQKLMPGTMLNYSLDLLWVNGKNEQQTQNPINGEITTINGESILMIPMEVAIKKRLFAGTMSSDLRPFVTAGAGVVYGWFIDTQSPRSFLPADQKKEQFTPTFLAGIGTDIGRPGGVGYGLDVKYQYLRFAHYLGERKKFDNIQVGFHVNF